MPKEHTIRQVKKKSIAAEMGIAPGDKLLAVNGTELEDIFDYQFLTEDAYLEVLVEKASGEQWLLEIDKEPEEDLGLVFESGLMDAYRSCKNRCVFCFIDQMPKGMRETLYFKDDDARLSFLQGNYVTLTNLSEHDIERICRYHLSPINISFHTMNPELRCRMLNNRFAGEALQKADALNAAGIRMNGQIVLCKGLNDGEELEFSIKELMRYIPNLESVSVVPVGLTKYREGLEPLLPFEKADAKEVLGLIHRYQDFCMGRHGIHFVHASDEWYALAGEELPEAERYDGYLQLENGVGMMRLLLDEFREAMEERRNAARKKCSAARKKCRVISMATGMLAYPYIRQMCQEIEEAFPHVTIRLYAIRNDFFGEKITVSGLLVGQDIRSQLSGQELGEALLLPQNLLRNGESVFLDDLTLKDLEKALQVPVFIVKSSGYDFLETILER